MTYYELKKLLKGKKLPLTATNQDGELMIIEEGKNDAGRFYRTSTVQRNDWLRINTYYEDGTTEETYRK